MKTIVTLALMLMVTVTFAQNKNAKATLEVDGVCGMCKARIEKAAIKTKGVKSALWNVETHKLSLIFNNEKTTVEAIVKNITAAGHDTKELKATDEAYNSVHPCCKYRDDDVKKDHEKETKTKTEN
jgi:cation transport ATPase